MQGLTTFNNQTMQKSEAVAIVCNFILDELLERATRQDEVRNYYDIAVVGYANRDIIPIIPEYCDRFASISELAQAAPRIKTRHLDGDDMCPESGFVLRNWIKPISQGKTPMHTALTYIYTLVDKWCSRPENQDSFPPIIFNITDGEASDATTNELIDISRQIQQTGTTDGNTLLINILLSHSADDECEIFPSDIGFYSDSEQRMTLFRMSSIMPKSMEPLVECLRTAESRPPYRGTAFNVTPDKLLAILNIGSESINIA
jgi:hypothetical protein